MSIVYILTNEAMPGYVKIGKTDNLERRLRELDNTSLPLPFECYYAVRVENAQFVERQIHSGFEDHRVKKNREFFEIAPERVVAILKLRELENVTPGSDIVETSDDQKALNRARERRRPFNFKMVEIPMGAVLIFTRNRDITCTVVSNSKVEFMGEVTSLSAAAQKAIESEGYSWKAVQGPAYWEYEGRILDEIRRELEFAEE